MYSGMADVAALTGSTAYVSAIDKIWENVAGKKLYITGGIGATAQGEAFGANYELPNMTAYNETCAAVACAFLDSNIFVATADAARVDELERSLYNGALAGTSLKGDSYFYENPLEAGKGRARWLYLRAREYRNTRAEPDALQEPSL